MEETLANPCTEARPLGQSERGERARRKEEKERRKGGGMEVELASYIKCLRDAAGSGGALEGSANRSSGGTSGHGQLTGGQTCTLLPKLTAGTASLRR